MYTPGDVNYIIYFGTKKKIYHSMNNYLLPNRFMELCQEFL